MFEDIIPGQSNRKAQRLQIEAEERQKDFALKQQGFDASTKADFVDLEIQQNRSDLIKWQQELDNELRDLIYQLKGVRQAADGTLYIPPGVVPLCNDLCIEQLIIPYLKSFMNKNQFNTNLDEDMIKNKVKKTANKFVINSGVKFEYYGFLQRQNLRTVHRLIKNYMMDSAYRSLKGWTKKTDSTNFKRLESSFDRSDENQKKNLFGF